MKNLNKIPTLIILGLNLTMFSAQAADDFDKKETKTTVIESDTVNSSNSAPKYPATESTEAQTYDRSEKKTMIEEQEPTFRRHAIRMGVLGGLSEIPSGGSEGLAGVSLEFGMGTSPISLGASYMSAAPGENVSRQTLYCTPRNCLQQRAETFLDSEPLKSGI